MPATESLLDLSDVHAFYGKSHVLQGLSMNVGRGECAALLGRNGAGKTTTLKAIMNLVRAQGRITVDGKDMLGREPFEVARAGIGYVPEHRGIFSTLTVEQNLAVCARKGSTWSMERVMDLFPRLSERRRSHGDQLSGGEQQMLAIARVLLAGPQLLLLDEPSEGLAPVIVEQITDLLSEIKQEGFSVLLVEQRLDFCLKLADRVYVLESGRLVYAGTKEEFEAAPEVTEKYLALSGAD